MNQTQNDVKTTVFTFIVLIVAMITKAPRHISNKRFHYTNDNHLKICSEGKAYNLHIMQSNFK